MNSLSEFASASRTSKKVLIIGLSLCISGLGLSGVPLIDCNYGFSVFATEMIQVWSVGAPSNQVLFHHISL
jgi:hypothetical protein